MMSKQNSIPQLRFKGFEAEWEFEKLQSRIKSIDSGWSPQCEEYPSTEDEWGVLKTTSVVWEGFNENANKKLPEKLNPRPELQVSINDILITRAGPTRRVGVTVHVNKVRPRLMLSDKLIRLRSNENCSSLFLAISLSNSSSQKQLVSKSSGLAESQTNISQKILLNTKLSFPTLPEQQKIASFLSAVYQKIQQLSRKKELLEQYKKGVMQQLLSGKLRFKDENGMDYSDWEEKKLGEVCDVRDGTHDSPKYVDKGFPFITSKNLMKNGSIDFENVSFINELDYNKINQRSKVNINDILFGMIGTIGNPVLVKSEGFAIKNVALIKEKKDLLNLFLIHFLKGDSINQQFFEQNTGGTQKFLSLSVIRNLITIVPSLPEQQKIANFLSGIDGKIEQVNGELVKTQEFKKGLLQQMFV
jgi:type I restriction enzyme S subunit